MRKMAVLEILFGRDRQHDNNPDKVRCTAQILWNLAHLRSSQYSSFMATMNVKDNHETVGSVARKFRNFESIIHGLMQAHFSAVVKSRRGCLGVTL